MAQELKDEHIDEKEGEQEGKQQNEKENADSRYSLTISIIKNNLELHLHDTYTKYIYHGSFDSNALQQCGFGNKQSSNLQQICKFMESARKGHQQLKFTISIEKNTNDQIDNGNIGIIKIEKEDDFFTLQITMKLKQTPRKEIDIVKEHIKDLQKENEGETKFEWHRACY